jgi:hypothetical protein
MEGDAPASRHGRASWWAFPSANTLAVVRYHQERWDGSGYPIGLSGKDIHLALSLSRQTRSTH